MTKNKPVLPWHREAAKEWYGESVGNEEQIPRLAQIIANAADKSSAERLWQEREPNPRIERLEALSANLRRRAAAMRPACHAYADILDGTAEKIESILHPKESN